MGILERHCRGRLQQCMGFSSDKTPFSLSFFRAFSTFVCISVCSSVVLSEQVGKKENHPTRIGADTSCDHYVLTEIELRGSIVVESTPQYGESECDSSYPSANHQTVVATFSATPIFSPFGIPYPFQVDSTYFSHTGRVPNLPKHTPSPEVVSKALHTFNAPKR